jgi:hypothetical protein
VWASNQPRSPLSCLMGSSHHSGAHTIPQFSHRSFTEHPSGSFEFELTSKRNVVPYLSLYQIAKFSKFWSNITMVFIIYKLGSVWKHKKIEFNGLGRWTVQADTGSDSRRSSKPWLRPIHQRLAIGETSTCHGFTGPRKWNRQNLDWGPFINDLQ